jgi:DNA-binding NtrC family response regulator
VNQTNRYARSEQSILLVGGPPEEQARDAQLLRSAGYVVKTAPTGLHAQQLLSVERVALVITEHKMKSGIDGIDLLAWVKAKNPKTRCMILTAKPRGVLVTAAKSVAHARTLIRPAKPEKLLTAVKEELDAYAE